MGVSGQHHAPAALYPGKGPTVPIVQEAGWAPEPVWTQRLEEKSLLSLHTVSIYLFPFLWWYILVSLLRTIPIVLNLHFDHWLLFILNCISVSWPRFNHHMRIESTISVLQEHPNDSTLWRISWTANVGRWEMLAEFWLESPNGRVLCNQGVDGRIILIVRK
jgi:hypothetical protein